MKHPLFGLGALTVGASLCLLGCDYGRGTVRRQADGLTTDTGTDDLRSGLSNTGRSPVMPGTWSKQAQSIENDLGR
jgi:hypothetical protein